MSAKKTLVLALGDHPFLIVSWQAGILMLLGGDVEFVEAYGDEVCRSAGTDASGEGSIALPMPAVVRLKRYVRPGVKRGVRMSRENVFLRDRFVCQYCHQRKRAHELNLDHVLPASRGGTKCWENVVASCYPCNDKKRNRTPEEAGMPLLRKPTRPFTLPRAALELEEAKVPREWAPYAQEEPQVLSA